MSGEANGQHAATQASLSRVETAIGRAMRRLEALRTIQQLLSEFSDLEKELGLSEPAVAPVVPVASRVEPDDHVVTNIFENHVIYPALGKGNNFERIRDFFIANGNEWEQAPRIGEALGLSRGTVATVLWTSHRDNFERANVAGSLKKKKWRLTETTYKEAAKQPEGGEAE